jgi:signal transduction histidine kinase
MLKERITMMLLFTFLLKVTLSLIYSYSDKKDKARQWGALTLLCNSSYEVMHFITDWFLPMLSENTFSYSILYACYVGILYIYLTIGPYCVLMFCIHYAELFSDHTRAKLKYLLLLPSIYFMTVPISLVQARHYHYYLWSSSYLLAGVVLLIYATIKETPRKPKLQKLSFAILFSPILLSDVVLSYKTDTSLFSLSGETIVQFIGLFSLIVIAILIFRTKIMGFKLNIKMEDQSFGKARKDGTSGTAMVNHAIKNKIVNIEMLTNQIKEYSHAIQHKGISEDAGYIQSELNHLLDMSKYMLNQNQFQHIEMNLSSQNLNQLITDAIQFHLPFCIQNHIQIHSEFSMQADFRCDRVHLYETLCNMIQNALDAVTSGLGVITIRLYQTKKDICIEIQDNGKGIPKDNLSKISEPYFSTKHSKQNFGLGLPYCYTIVKKHGGTIEVRSQLGKGSTFTIHLPRGNSINAQELEILSIME